MKVLGFTEEVTTCDCCGKRNLKGSFAIETDAGDAVYYGSVCVNKVYGSKRGKAIQLEARMIQKVNANTWDRTVDLYSRGFFSAYVVGIKADGKMAINNSGDQMSQIVAFKNAKTGAIIRAVA